MVWTTTDANAANATPYAIASVAGRNAGEYASYFVMSNKPSVTTCVGSKGIPVLSKVTEDDMGK